MPNSPLQGFPTPALSDPSNIPSDMSILANAVEKRVFGIYASAAERSTKVTAPVAGQVSFLVDTKRTEVYNGTAWVLQTPAGTVRRIGSVQRTTSSTASGSEQQAAVLTIPGPVTTTSLFRVTAMVAVVAAGGAAHTTDITLKHGFGIAVGGTVMAAGQIQHTNTFAHFATLVGEFNPDAAGSNYMAVATIKPTAGTNTNRQVYGATTIPSWFVVDEIL